MNRIRKIRQDDQTEYLDMAADFYASGAVCHPVPPVHFERTFQELMRSEEYAQAYIMQCRDCIAGYALLARTFSQEAGGAVLWIEELYVKPDFRDRGLGHEFFAFLQKHMPPGVMRVRLEAERANRRAVSLYRKMGFTELPYFQMICDVQEGFVLERRTK